MEMTCRAVVAVGGRTDGPGKLKHVSKIRKKPALPQLADM